MDTLYIRCPTYIPAQFSTPTYQSPNHPSSPSTEGRTTLPPPPPTKACAVAVGVAAVDGPKPAMIAPPIPPLVAVNGPFLYDTVLPPTTNPAVPSEIGVPPTVTAGPPSESAVPPISMPVGCTVKVCPSVTMMLEGREDGRG
jgi:hypothetical protein